MSVSRVRLRVIRVHTCPVRGLIAIGDRSSPAGASPLRFKVFIFCLHLHYHLKLIFVNFDLSCFQFLHELFALSWLSLFGEILSNSFSDLFEDIVLAEYDFTCFIKLKNFNYPFLPLHTESVQSTSLPILSLLILNAHDSIRQDMANAIFQRLRWEFIIRMFLIWWWSPRITFNQLQILLILLFLLFDTKLVEAECHHLHLKFEHLLIISLILFWLLIHTQSVRDHWPYLSWLAV